MKTGQLSTEAMFALGVVMVLFLILSVVMFERRSETIAADDLLTARKECFTMANLISTVYSRGDGSYANATFYQLLQVRNNSVISVVLNKTNEEEAFCSYLGRITTAVGTDRISNVTGNVEVRNRGGLVAITQF